jgi:putative phage-type endonuclease
MSTDIRTNWLAERKNGIGGSDVGAILGVNPYRSRLDVWLDKTGKGADVVDNYAMARGRAMEPFIREWFVAETGLTVEVTEGQTVSHPKHDFLRASYDGLTSDDGILEIKTMSQWVAKKGEIPESYYWQIQHYMYVAGREHGYFAIDSAGTFIIEQVQFDERYTNEVLPKLNDFWNHVLADTPPPAQKRDNIEPTIDDAITVDAYGLGTLERLKAVKEQIKELKKKQELCEDELLQQLDGHTTLIDANGKTLATHKAVTTNRFDSTRFKKEQADMYKQYMKATTSNRLTIK